MRSSAAFVLIALPLLAAAAPVDTSSAKLVNARGARTVTVSSYSEQLRRDHHRIQPESSRTATTVHTRQDHTEANSPEMEDGYDAGKTMMDDSDHKIAQTASDPNVPTVIGYPVKSVADGTAHKMDSEMMSNDQDKSSPKGQAEGHGKDGKGLKVEIDAEKGGLEQGL